MPHDPAKAMQLFERTISPNFSSSFLTLGQNSEMGAEAFHMILIVHSNSFIRLPTYPFVPCNQQISGRANANWMKC